MSNTNPLALNDAIAAARAGRRDDAARMLRELVAGDPFNADAWVWLAGVTSDFREQRSALEQALTIAPDNGRAQQGLNWLRHSHPEVFDGPATGSTITRPRSDRTTPSYEQRAITPEQGARTYETVVLPPSQQDGGGARTYETQLPTGGLDATQRMETQFAPPQRNTFDAPTQPLSVPPAPAQNQEPLFAPSPQQPRSPSPEPFFVPPSQTDRMPAHNTSAPANPYQPVPTVDARRADRTVAPPPPAAPAIDHSVAAPRDNRGNLSRWLLILIWLVGLGASATIAALFILNPNNFEGFVRSSIDPVLRPAGFQLDLGNVALTAFITTIVLIGLAVLDLVIVLGLIFRGRWAWVINLLFMLLVVAGTVALIAGLTFVASPLELFTSPVIIGLAVFALIYLIVSFTSRRAFFRRRTAQAYAR